MLKLLFFLLNSVFLYVRKIVLVFVVLAAIILTFIFFMQNEKLSINNNALKEANRQSIYSTIKKYEKDESSITKLTVVMYRATLCGFVGEGCTNNPSDGNKNSKNSLVGGMASIISAPFFHPPASSIAWVQNGLEKAGFVPNTYAAEGIGFSSIKGYLTIWKVFRDITFLILVLFMVIIGFLIMFRVKMDGQAAITIQSILPRIVITMILITFSFAIVGFLVDLMYGAILVGTSLLFKLEPLRQSVEQIVDPNGLLSPTQLSNQVLVYQQNYLVAPGHFLWPARVIGRGFPGGLGTGTSVFSVGTALFEVLPQAFQGIIESILTLSVGFLITQGLTKWLDLAVVKPFTGFGLSGLGFGVNFGGMANFVMLPVQIIIFALISAFLPGLVLGIIVLLTIVLFVFRLFFMILSSYLKILIYLIFSPIIIMFNILPGNNSFSWWIKNLIGELLVFPTVILIVLTGQAVMQVDVAYNSAFRLPFLYGIDAKAFGILVALGIVLLTPDFIKMVKKFVGAEEAPFELGIGTFLGGTSIVTGAMGMGQNLMGLKHTLTGRKMMGTEKGLFDFIPGLGGIAESVRKASELP
jgi:hypothetical protein